MVEAGTLYWITGLSGAGKTTIGNRLYYEIKKTHENVILLDGDVLKRTVMDDDETDVYSDASRRRRALRYARICKMLTDQGVIVICCTIAMYDAVRDWNRKNNKRYVEVFLDVPMTVLEQRDQKGLYSKVKHGDNQPLAGVNLNVEFPKQPDVTIKNDGTYTVGQCVDMIMSFETKLLSDYDRDTAYWNNYYDSKTDSVQISEPSLFAKEVTNYVSAGKNLLELGCGNGRDSLYFDSVGIHVTAIDASDKAIAELEATKTSNASFICDDFVTASALFTGQYDYVYSRFSLHAINAEQEGQVITNVYNVLKETGLFFIEVRSVNDEIYGLGEKVGEDSYFYQGHFRRFIRIKDLEKKLEDAGFKIKYAEESRGFAPFGNDDPMVIRVIAER